MQLISFLKNNVVIYCPIISQLLFIKKIIIILEFVTIIIWKNNDFYPMEKFILHKY